MNVAKNVLRLALTIAAPLYTSDFGSVPLVLVDVADLPSSTISAGSDILYTVLSKEAWNEISLQTDGSNAGSDSYLAVANLYDQESIDGKKVSKVLVGVNRSTTWLLTFNAVWALTQSFIACVAAVKDGGTSGTITDLLATAKKVQEVGRIYCGTTDDANAKGADAGGATLLSKLKTDDVNSFVIYSEDDEAFAVSCELGKILPNFIPCVNPCYKPLTGVDGDTLTDAQFGYIQAKRGNILLNDGNDVVMIAFNGQSDTGGHYGGICSNGNFFDIEYAKAYMNLEIPLRFYENYVKRKKKFSFNTMGSQEVTAALINIVNDIGIIEPPEPFIEEGFIITVPDMSSTSYSSAKRSQRHLDGIEGSGSMTGAVNVFNVSLNFI